MSPRAGGVRVRAACTCACLIRRVARVAPAANERQDVAAEEHLHDADAAIGKVCARQSGLCVGGVHALLPSLPHRQLRPLPLPHSPLAARSESPNTMLSTGTRVHACPRRFAYLCPHGTPRSDIHAHTPTCSLSQSAGVYACLRL
eukprot:5314939-Pleurochrysis_carterae.AAC.1